MSTQVETTRTSDRVTISFPIDEFRSDEIDEIVSLVKVALIARKWEASARALIAPERFEERARSLGHPTGRHGSALR